jgi:hypothetical protein
MIRKNKLNFMDRPFLNVFLPVRFLKFIIICSLLLGVHAAMAQDEPQERRGSKIIDDTTKQVYGPKTTRYYFEEDIMANRVITHFIDTVIRNFHRFNYVQRYNNLFQDLGNIGTAIRPIYYQVPDAIGATSGFSTYDLYWDEEHIRYYDTKSPYSNMRVILGGQGRSMTRVTYSRNISPRWNFGFNFRALLIDKQVARTGKGDRNVRSNYYDFYTTYANKDSTYRLFFNFQRGNHQAAETGGILDARSLSYESLFEKNKRNALEEASSNELRINVHFTHQYEIGKALQIYHTFDRYRQGNRFNEIPASEPDDFYDYVEIDSPRVSDRVKFKYVRNEIGIKGNLLKLFYNGYYAIRDYSMTYNHLDESVDSIGVKTSGLEHYLGGRISLRLDSIGEVTARAELLQTGNYRLEGMIKSRWFEASLKQVQYAPTFLQQLYRGSFDVWENNFTNINVTQVNGYLHYRSPVFSVSPGVTFTRMGNYVFFKEDDYLKADGVTPQPQKVLPVQTAGEQVMVLPEVRMELVMAKHIFLRGQGIFAKVLKNTGEAIQIPQLFVNGQIAYENIFFDGNLDMHAGVDVHYKSAYTPLAYDVPIQQFYVQKEGQSYEVPDFPIIDVFFNARIKRARIFVKYNNLIQAFTKQGYMPTPYFIGQRNLIDFGFDWSFYD